MALRCLSRNLTSLLRLAPPAFGAERQGLRMLAAAADGQGIPHTYAQPAGANGDPLPEDAEIEHAVSGYSRQSIELENTELLSSPQQREPESPPATEGGHASDAQTSTEAPGQPSSSDAGNGGSRSSAHRVQGWQPTGKYFWNRERTDREARRAKYARDEFNRSSERGAGDFRNGHSRQAEGTVQPNWHFRQLQPGHQNKGPPRASVKVHWPVRITNFGRLASRRDVQRLLADCTVPSEEISQLLFRLRLEYSHAMTPRAFYANLFTPKAQERALAWNGSLIGEGTGGRGASGGGPQAGRPISITAVTRMEMQIAILSPLAMGSKGRFVLVNGIQENANLEDIVRYFSGYELMGNPVTILKREEKEYHRDAWGAPLQVSRAATTASMSSIRAVVRFATTQEAHRAMREKQCGFLLNAPVTMILLQ